jgi:chromosome partitioning protein
MQTKIIAFINQKGGCGKTTLSMNVGATLALRHAKKVAIIDGDNQGSATKWAGNVSDDKEFPCSVLSLAKSNGLAHREIKKMMGMYDFIVVDCPPNTEAQINASILLVADLAVIPFNPSPLDLRAIEELRPLIEAASINNEKLKVVALVNRADNRNVSAAVEVHFKNNENITLLDTKIKSRAIYCETELIGESVYTSNVSQARNEISLLVDEIIEYLI